MKIRLTENQLKLIKENENKANDVRSRITKIGSALNKVYSSITLESVSDILTDSGNINRFSDIIDDLDREITKIDGDINRFFANDEFEHFMFELDDLNHKNRLKYDVLYKIITNLKEISEINSELGYDISINQIFSDVGNIEL